MHGAKCVSIPECKVDIEKGGILFLNDPTVCICTAPLWHSFKGCD